MYSQDLRKKIVEACGDFSSLNPACVKTLSEMETQIGNFDGMFILTVQMFFSNNVIEQYLIFY